MITTIDTPVVLHKGQLLPLTRELMQIYPHGRDATMAAGILDAHNSSGEKEDLQLRFDAMASHDITYVGIIQTARAGGLEHFPMPYVLTNCHNSLCAVGGTVNEDDHAFGLSAAKRYGGIYVPAHQAVIHAYMRENFAGCGKMILGSDSHTRYGALGCLAIGEGGPELVKQLLGRTYDIKRPPVVAVMLTGTPRPGVGPQDVALAIIGKVFASGFFKNKILEFMGDGVASLSVEYRNGIDVMTTETTCLSTVWVTDGKVKDYLTLHGRGSDFRPMAPGEGATYDGALTVELDKVESMIALPFHPGNVHTIRNFLAHGDELLADCEEYAHTRLGVAPGSLDLRSKFKNGRMQADQGVIAGCAGGIYDNIAAAADILQGADIGNGAFTLSVYPASASVQLAMYRDGLAETLTCAGATVRSAFCGPCFGAGDVPRHGGFSLRHTTRNFPMREGAKPGERQAAAVALMDARSIAATAAAGGILTPADEGNTVYTSRTYRFDDSVYRHRVYNGFGHPLPEEPLILGPGITDWPSIQPLPRRLLLSVASVITDPVTTTDELIPSGDTSSYRSDPERLSSFTLSRKDPAYVGRARAIRTAEYARRGEQAPGSSEAADLSAVYAALGITDPAHVMLGSLVAAVKPGDGSAREQAASCQRVLGGCANIAVEYATKRYRSNLINWGLLPFTAPEGFSLSVGDCLYFENLREQVLAGAEEIDCRIVRTNGSVGTLRLALEDLSEKDRLILAEGCLMNYYRSGK